MSGRSARSSNGAMFCYVREFFGYQFLSALIAFYQSLAAKLATTHESE
jgi:hypothetical protein